jgi:GINS complex protein
LGEILLQAAPDDFEDVDQVRRLMRDLREVRMAKIRSGVDVLDAGGGIKFNGVGGLEVCEGRGFIGGVIDGLRYVLVSLLHVNTLILITIDALPPRKNKRREKRTPKIERTAMEEHKMMTTICYNNKPMLISIEIYSFYKILTPFYATRPFYLRPLTLPFFIYVELHGQITPHVTKDSFKHCDNLK